MPELPGYNAKKNITANTAAPLREEAAQPFEQDRQLLKTVADVGQQWSNANDVMQYTDAKARHGLAITDIQNRAAADPDFKNSEKYSKELAAVTKSAAAGISNQQVASKANAEFGYDSQIADMKIKTNFRQKQIEYNKVQVKTNMDMLLQNKLAASTPQEAMLYDEKLKALIHDNVVTGVLDPKEAEKLLNDSQKTAVQYDIYSDPATQEQDSKVLADLKDPKGKYSFLPPDTRLDLITESQRRVFQNNQTFKKEVEASQVTKNNDFIEKLSTGTANFKDIDRELQVPEEQGGMKRSVLLQYQKYLQTGVEKTLNEYLKEKNNGEPTRRSQMAKQYNDLIEAYMDDKTDYWKAKELLAQGLKDGVLDADELKLLNPLKDGLNDIKFNKDTGPIATVIKKVKSWMGKNNASSEDISIRLKQMLNDIGSGSTPQQAQAKIMDAEMLKFFPDHQQYPKEGKKFIDKKSGRAYVVYADGKWAWVEGKNKEAK